MKEGKERKEVRRELAVCQLIVPLVKCCAEAPAIAIIFIENRAGTGNGLSRPMCSSLLFLSAFDVFPIHPATYPITCLIQLKWLRLLKSVAHTCMVGCRFDADYCLHWTSICEDLQCLAPVKLIGRLILICVELFVWPCTDVCLLVQFQIGWRFHFSFHYVQTYVVLLVGYLCFMFLILWLGKFVTNKHKHR